MKALLRMFPVYLLLGLLALAVALAAVVGSAQAQSGAGLADGIVGPGESIQAAVGAADPGDTIVVRGVHRENVVIRKNGISLRGAGAVLRPPASQNAPCGPSGICLLGDVDFQTGEVSRRVSGVSVSGFTVRGFEDTGIIALGARDASFVANRTFGNGEYGIAAFSSTGTRVVANDTRGGGTAGIYIGDASNANASIRANDTSDNELGIFIRNARQGTIAGNNIHGNCQGVLFLADAPGPSGNFAVKGNAVRNNTKACPPEDGVPPLSGAGLTLAGARGVEITGNQITGNAASGPSVFSGGVVVVRGIGGTAPVNNSVSANAILRNDPDIFWDESGTGNRFANNRCETSVPARLCG